MKINMKINTRKLVALPAIALTLLVAPLTANAATCIIDSATPAVQLKPQIKLSEETVLASLTAMDKTVSTALDFQTATINAAVQTLTSQKALSAKQAGQSMMNNSQIKTNAEQQVKMAHRAKEVVIDYGASSAGHKVCQVLAERKAVKDSGEIKKKAVMGMVNTEVTARPGKYSSTGSAKATRMALHDALYCTESQAASNLCTKPAPRAGASLKAATLFVPADEGSPEYRDKSAFINNMVGFPDDPLTPEGAATIAGQSYSDLKRRKDATKSTAITSLKNIQAEWSGFTGNHKPGDETSDPSVDDIASSEAKQLANADKMPNASEKTGTTIQPLAVKIQNDVNRYLGAGPEYQEWSKTLVGAAERGVLKEVLQVKALRLYLQSQQYDQLARMESMLAATVAAETYRTGMESNIERQRQSAIRRNIKGAYGN